MSNLLKRFLTCLVLLPIVVYSLYMGEIVFTCFVLLIVSLAFWEYEKMLQVRNRNLAIGSYMMLLFITVTAFINPPMFLYLSFAIPMIWLIRIIISSINDISAYIVGKFFGVTKAFPNVSPNKTYEGSIAGIISSVIVTVWLFNYFNLMIPFAQSMFIGMIVSFLGIIGDLVESFIKRKSGVKDTGNLLPGHGGVLDRIDSLIVILPFFYIIIIYLGY
jgi:phosphatidate cytidylyltransferase